MAGQSIALLMKVLNAFLLCSGVYRCALLTVGWETPGYF